MIVYISPLTPPRTLRLYTQLFDEIFFPLLFLSANFLLIGHQNGRSGTVCVRLFIADKWNVHRTSHCGLVMKYKGQIRDPIICCSRVIFSGSTSLTFLSIFDSIEVSPYVRSRVSCVHRREGVDNSQLMVLYVFSFSFFLLTGCFFFLLPPPVFIVLSILIRAP